jgi:hypothetical protein
MTRLLVAVTALVLTLSGARSAEITRILVGFPPGQATDIVARLLADRLGPLLGESVIVENRPGQSGADHACQIACRANHAPTSLPADWAVVQPLLPKYFCFSEYGIGLYPCPFRATKGRFAVVTNAARDAVDVDRA